MSVVEVAKIGTGTVDDPYRPDTSSKDWQVVEEKPTTFVIQILDETLDVTDKPVP